MQKTTLLIFSLFVSNVLSAVVTSDNDYYKVNVDFENGAWSASTGSSHVAGADHEIIYGGSTPSTTYFTVRDFDNDIEYSNSELVPDTTTLDVISSSNVDRVITMVFGLVPAKRAVASFQVTVVWTTIGTSDGDAAIKYTAQIENTGSESVRLGFRWLLDYQVDGDDGTSFATYHPTSGKYGVERQWDSPDFEQYIAAGNVNNVPYVALGSVQGPVDYDVTVTPMDRVVFASYEVQSSNAWTVNIDTNDTIVKLNLGDDTCVISYWNIDGSRTLAGGESMDIANGISYVSDPQFNNEECKDAFTCTYDYLSVRQWGSSTDCIHVPQDYPCQDTDPCTIDKCDPTNHREDGTSDGCVHIQIDCNDDISCTDDSCVDGECVHDDRSCADAHECTHDSCSEELGGCLNRPDNSLCGPAEGEAADLCNTWYCDVYEGCVTKEKDCDDQIACTIDTCDAEEGCLHEEDHTKCNDRVDCTNDFCDSSVGKCVNVRDDTVCDDGNACTIDYCDVIDGCEAVPIICEGPDTHCLIHLCLEGECVKLADDYKCDDDKPCTVDTCDPHLGQCTNIPDDTLCDDGKFCTRDWCNEVSGQCEHAAIECPEYAPCAPVQCDEELRMCIHVRQDSMCSDDIGCTEDKCDLNLGECTHHCNNSLCVPANACQEGTCQCDYGCVFTEKYCNDQLACTDDTCNTESGECEHEAQDSACDDDVPCTNDSCSKLLGRCVNDPANSNCDDDIQCSVDICDPEKDCVHIYKNELCADEFECTINTCTSEGCQVDAADGLCDDKIDCTLDECSVTEGCKYTPVDRSCVDEHECTINSCSAENGCEVEYDHDMCNDDIECTVDTCTDYGCQHVAMHSLCNDDVGCTDDYCESVGNDTGCVHTPVHSYCDDSRACSVEYCDKDWDCVVNITSCGVDSDCEHCISCGSSLSRIGVNDNDDGSGDMILMTRNAPVPLYSVASPVNDLTSNVIMKGSGAIIFGTETIIDELDGLVIGHDSAFKLVPTSEQLPNCNDMARGLISVVEVVQGRETVDRMYICLYDNGVYDWKLLNDQSCDL